MVNNKRNGARRGSAGGGAKAFGTLLRFYREKAKVSRALIADETGYSTSLVAMVEAGDRGPRGELAPIADKLLGADGALVVVAKEVIASSSVIWFEDYLTEEEKAAAVYQYEPQLIPGLLQTEAYARAVYHQATPSIGEEETEEYITTRLARHQLFTRKPLPTISFVLEESALKKRLGGAAVLKENLLHILEVGKLRNVEIQVMAEDTEYHAGLNGSFVLLETGKDHSHLVYVEGQDSRYFLTEQPQTSNVAARYSILRAQAYTPNESLRLIEEMAARL
ncbi:helix-turn-helix transcriptional regulator [Streptomyces sp. NPDC046887]|uniref:helix-turn-helix domain-containing protein n=1 Tax=Streptomyces sp. NPDC046887 TaxID=3155472 RepID=UPI0033DEE1B7